MPWWGWALLVWPLLGVGVTLLLASAIRLADREERRRVGRTPVHPGASASPRDDGPVRGSTGEPVRFSREKSSE